MTTTATEHRHRPKGDPINVYAYSGPINGAVRRNERADGNVCYEERCRCGATRLTNVNTGEREYGPWGE
jgi:hypothetical protein